MSDPKKITIVVPTRNRDEYLKYSLQCIQTYEYKNLEVLVSNNSTLEHYSETKKIIDSEINRKLNYKIKYIQPPKPLGMSDHWEFCLNNIDSDYFVFQCDDDCLSPFCLEKSVEFAEANHLDSVCWSNWSYYHPDWNNDRFKNTIQSGRKTDNEIKCSKIVLKQFFNEFWMSCIYPRILNGITSTKLAKKIQKENGRFFHIANPDAASAVNILINTKNFGILGGINGLSGCAAKSGAANAVNYEKAQKSIVEYGDVDLLEFSPCKIPVAACFWVDTMIRTAFANNFTVQINEFNLYKFIYTNMQEMQNNGADMSKWVKQWENDAAAALGTKQANEIKRILTYYGFFDKVKYYFKNPIAFKNRIINLGLGTKNISYNGYERCFSNLFEANKFMIDNNLYSR